MAAQNTTIMKRKKKKMRPPDPFEEYHEEAADDCIEELCEIAADCPEDLDEELKNGYGCTKKQLVYWLKKKYAGTTSCGEDLLEYIQQMNN